MKKIKVDLVKPWAYSSESYYKILIENPPDDIEYIKEDAKVISNQRKYLFSEYIKNSLHILFEYIRLPLIKAKYVKNKGDLIHCEHFLCLNKDTPWVADFEGPWQIYIGGKTEWRKKKALEIMSRPNCKKILAWTDYAKNEFIKEFPSIKHKFDVLYPTIKGNSEIISNKLNKTLLFVSRSFYDKGGLYALEIMDRVTKKNKDIKAIFISSIPDDVREIYSKNKNITIYNMVNHDFLIKNIYPNSSIFVYPGFLDSFGFAYLEAMSFGLPIITIKKYNTIELLENGINGYLIDYNSSIDLKSFEKEEKLLNTFCEKTESILNNEFLLKKMSSNNIDRLTNGRFSIKKRNDLLRKVYLDALYN